MSRSTYGKFSFSPHQTEMVIQSSEGEPASDTLATQSRHGLRQVKDGAHCLADIVSPTLRMMSSDEVE